MQDTLVIFRVFKYAALNLDFDQIVISNFTLIQNEAGLILTMGSFPLTSLIDSLASIGSGSFLLVFDELVKGIHKVFWVES